MTQIAQMEVRLIGLVGQELASCLGEPLGILAATSAVPHHLSPSRIHRFRLGKWAHGNLKFALGRLNFFFTVYSVWCTRLRNPALRTAA